MTKKQLKKLHPQMSDANISRVMHIFETYEEPKFFAYIPPLDEKGKAIPLKITKF